MSSSGDWPQSCPLVRSAGYFECAPSWTLPERTKLTNQVWLLTSGSLTATLDRRVRCRIEPGGVLLVRAGVPHGGFHSPDDPLHCYVLHFVEHPDERRLRLQGRTFAATKLPGSVWPEMLRCAAEIVAETRAAAPGASLLAHGALSRLLGLLQRALSTGRVAVTAVESDRDAPPAVARVIEHVGAHFGSRLTLDALSEVACLSSSHLEHLFHTSVGVSPLQYVRRYRLDVAMRLLEETDLPVRAVAAKVGYADPFYFSRAFRQAEGMSPTRYRELAAQSSAM